MLSRLIGWQRQSEGLLGFADSVSDTGRAAIADIVLRSSVHSSLVVLAIHDIAASRFYESQISEMLDRFPGHVSWIDNITEYLAPYVSEAFQDIVGSKVADGLIATFSGYYLSRLPVLVAHCPVDERHPNVGLSDTDLKLILVRASLDLKKLFPSAWASIAGDGPDDARSIYQGAAAGGEMARKHRLVDRRMKEYLSPTDELFRDIRGQLYDRGPVTNPLLFFRAIVEGRLAGLWYDYLSSYRDTIEHWNIAGGFAGGQYDLDMNFWRDLGARVQSRDWLIRAAVGWP